MTTKIKYLTAVAALSLMTATSAFADKLEVGGNLLNRLNVNGDATNLASGRGSTADQSIGSISGDSDVDVGGSLSNLVAVNGDARNLSTGFRTEACQEIGSVGNKNACD